MEDDDEDADVDVDDDDVKLAACIVGERDEDLNGKRFAWIVVVIVIVLSVRWSMLSSKCL